MVNIAKISRKSTRTLLKPALAIGYPLASAKKPPANSEKRLPMIETNSRIIEQSAAEICQFSSKWTERKKARKSRKRRVNAEKCHRNRTTTFAYWQHFCRCPNKTADCFYRTYMVLFKKINLQQPPDKNTHRHARTHTQLRKKTTHTHFYLLKTINNHQNGESWNLTFATFSSLFECN